MSSISPYIPLLSALIGGALAATISYITTGRQIKIQRDIADSNRLAQVQLLYYNRRVESLQRWWLASIKLESGEDLELDEFDQLVGDALWLPAGLRKIAMSIVRGKGSVSEKENLHSTLRNLITNYVEGE